MPTFQFTAEPLPPVSDPVIRSATLFQETGQSVATLAEPVWSWFSKI